MELAESISANTVNALPESPEEPEKMRFAYVKNELDPFLWIPEYKRWLRYFLDIRLRGRGENGHTN